MRGCRTGRQPDPNRTSYDAFLYAFLIDVSLNASPLAFLSVTCAPVRSASRLNVRVAHAPANDAAHKVGAKSASHDCILIWLA